MDALNRCAALVRGLWPERNADLVARYVDGRSVALVFDADDGDGAEPLASAHGASASDAAEALAAVLAGVARDRAATLLSLAGDASTRADLAADVARLERALADRTRELGVTLDENDGLRAQLEAAREEIRARASAIGALAAGHAPDFAALADRLDGCALHALRRIAERLDDQAAHRAAGELLAAVAYETRQMEWIASVTESDAIRGALTNRAEHLREMLAGFGYVRSDQVQGSAEGGVEGGEGHERTVAPATGCRESRGGELS